MHSYKRLIPYILRQWRWLIAIVVLTLIAASMSALQPWPMKLLVDYALGDAAIPASFESALALVGLEPTPMVLVVCAAVASLAFGVLGNLLGSVLSLSWIMSGQRMVYDLVHDLFRQLQRLSLGFHSRRHVGDSLTRLSDDTWCLYILTDGLLVAPFQHVVTLVALGGFAFTLDPFLATIAVALAPLLGGSSVFFGKHLKRRSRQGQEAKSRIASFLQQTLSSMPVVHVFSTADRNTERFDRLADDVVVLSQRGNLLGSTYGFVNGLITTGGTATILFLGGIRVLDGAMTLGTLLIFLSYISKMQTASSGLFKIFSKLKTAEASIDRVVEILDSNERVHEKPDAVELPDRPRGERGHIQFDGVTFGYDQQRPVLKNVSLEVWPGETVALVGPTGAGKSTLVSLIPRFFDPSEGAIRFDGYDLRDLKLERLRSNVGMVLQEPYLLPISVSENIAYGCPEATRDEIVEVAKMARAHEFIERLPDGYDTVIGERGDTLSGGERQRLAVARAMLKDAPVLILDEPTSSLDSNTESSLLDALDALMAGRTTFIIAHRLSTIRDVDRVYVLDQGELVEQGTPRELLDSGGLFSQLSAQQNAEPNQVVA